MEVGSLDRQRPWTHRLRPLLAGLALLLLLVWRLGPAERPGPEDPSRWLAGGMGPVPVQLRGQLLEDPRPSPAAAPGCRVLLETSGGRSELVFARCPPLHQGWVVRVSGALRRPPAAPHPLLAGGAERLARQATWSRLTVERLEVLERPATPIVALRRRIAERLIAAAGPERGGLLAALVLGSAVVPLPWELREDFRASGLSHALAASGFHLTVLLGAVLVLGRPLGRPLRLALAAGAILLFLLLAGPQASVVRAVVMGSVALLALEAGRRTRPLGLLILTVVLMLLLQPAWFHDLGFQLSVAATAGLVITATPLEQAIAARLPAGRGGQGGCWRRHLAPALAVPVAATLWTLPLQLLHFGAVPLFAVPANLAAAPLLTPLTLAAMALALVALVLPAVVPALLLPVDPLARLLLAIAHGFAALPMAQWRTGRPLPLLVALFALGLLPLLLPGAARRWRRLGALLLILVAALHLGLLGADQLLLVHQGSAGGSRDLLIARHRGRAALISTRADPFSCQQVRQLANGLGVDRFDWQLLLDPVAPADPACWQRQGGLVVAYGEERPPLAAGQGLASPGLAVEALSMDSHALLLRLGRRAWLLLPDRQALQAWRDHPRPRPDGVWLGFRPGARERRRWQASAELPARVWLSGAPPGGERLPSSWSTSGASGSLLAYGG